MKILKTLETARAGYASLLITAYQIDDKIMVKTCEAHHKMLNEQIVKLGGEDVQLPKINIISGTPAVNFTNFCENASLEQIKKALTFYTKEFVVTEVLEYFLNWEIIYDDSKYKNGTILINNHSNGKRITEITINDDSEYMFGKNDRTWQRIPKTISEFISDVLRYEDFELLLSEKGYNEIY